MICKNCGGDIDVIPGVTKYRCPYCDSENFVFDSQSPGPQPTAIAHVICAKTDEKRLHSLLLSKMIEDQMAPDDILTASVIQEETVMYVPCFVTRGTFDINWTASFGYDRREAYVAYVTVAEGGQRRTRPVTQYRTVTDWKPASGNAAGNYAALGYAGSNLSKEAAALVEGLPTSYLIPYTPAYVEGFTVEPFYKKPEEVEGSFDDSIQKQEYAAVARHFQGDRQRDVHFNSKRKPDFVQPGLLPAAHAVFAYKDKQYNLWADGIDLSRVITDYFPRDKTRGSKIARGLWPVIVAFVALAATLFFTGDFTPLALAGPILGLIYYYARKHSIIGYSKRIREATLAAKKLEDNDQVGHLTNEETLALRQKATEIGVSLPLLAKTDLDPLVIPFLTIVFGASTYVLTLFFH
ncbi:MAG: hypothetical protein LBF41_09560 [Deltaproteobacteria bacterium]|nr:hypothetical protein [Deltaproteobacteria bacterium]